MTTIDPIINTEPPVFSNTTSSNKKIFWWAFTIYSLANIFVLLASGYLLPTGSNQLHTTVLYLLANSIIIGTPFAVSVMYLRREPKTPTNRKRGIAFMVLVFLLLAGINIFMIASSIRYHGEAWIALVVGSTLSIGIIATLLLAVVMMWVSLKIRFSGIKIFLVAAMLVTPIVLYVSQTYIPHLKAQKQLQLALATHDEKLCEHLPVRSKFDDTPFQKNCFHPIAVAKGNVSICDRISTESWRVTCVAAIAAQTKNISICYSVLKEWQIRDCVTQALLNMKTP